MFLLLLLGFGLTGRGGSRLFAPAVPEFPPEISTLNQANLVNLEHPKKGKTNNKKKQRKPCGFIILCVFLFSYFCIAFTAAFVLCFRPGACMEWDREGETKGGTGGDEY